MSIFDALKYPVADDMHMDDFRAIPLKMREAWVEHPDFVNIYPTPSTADAVAHAKVISHLNMNLLRKIIAEWP